MAQADVMRSNITLVAVIEPIYQIWYTFMLTPYMARKLLFIKESIILEFEPKLYVET